MTGVRLRRRRIADVISKREENMESKEQVQSNEKQSEGKRECTC